ncbi:progranulin [Caerostris extrusa]|uniref:Progranulin n=1 Tax=Caerostris extrusa TaxID=172846 RepID=A0AAV4QV17_CAEEX|nr:progranulin [Caerostris extrusa]
MIVDQFGELKMRAFVALFLSVVVCSAYGNDCTEESCTRMETCCEGPVPGVYGCCPQPNAVCCSDGLHCCPANTVCDLSAGTCDSLSGERFPFIPRKKIDIPVEEPMRSAPLVRANQVNVVYCPGGQYYCNDGNTCCRMPTGQYSCCPYPYASCCLDGVHCCPSGLHCDNTSQYCLRGSNSYAALLKRPAFPLY